MRSASFAARSCSGALLLLSVLTLPGLTLGSGPDDPPRLAVAPTIDATVPARDAVNVSLTSAIVVRFSEPMDPTSLNATLPPSANLIASWPTSSVLHLTPDPPGLTNCTVYALRVRANDTDEGFPLAPGAVPNPWSFMSACDLPYVVSTVPADGANNVRPSANVVVTFSEAMDCLTVGIGLNPPTLNPPGTFTTGCDASQTVWTLRFSGGTTFVTGTTYVATVTGQSNDTNDGLVPSTVPNPWTFLVNDPPSVSKPTLSFSGCLDPGTVQIIGWSMSDDLDAAPALSVRILFLNGSTWETVFGPATGLASPAQQGWSLPPVDATTRVRVEVTDTAGASDSNESDSFRIDRGPPSVFPLTDPRSDATDVPTDNPITIPFSEPMNRTAVENAISAVPALLGPIQFDWFSENATVRVRPGPLTHETTYEVTISAAATDTCSPGRPMVAPYAFRFTTRPAPPAIPARLSWSAYDETSVTLTWDPVTTYITGDPILPPLVVTYRVYRGNLTNWGSIGETGATSFRDAGLQPKTDYYYRVAAFVNGTESSPSAALHVRTLAPFLERSEGRWSILAALSAVGVAAVIAAEMRRRRRKAEAEAALTDEIQEVVDLVRKVRHEADPEVRRKEEAALQQHFRVLVEGGEETDEGFRADPRLEGLYRALAQALVRAPEVNVAGGRALVDERLGDLVPRFREHGAAYRLLSEAEASVQSELFRTLPESARKALLLVYFYGLEVYLNIRLRGLVPMGATVLLGERGHINVRRRGWEAQWAGLTLGNLLYVMDRNTHFFVADLGRWQKDVEPLLRQAVEARNRTAHPSRQAPPLDRVQDLVYRAIPAVESVLKWPKGPAAG